MTQEQEWQNWREQEYEILGESIAWAANVFETTDVGIEKSRHYGAALLAHRIECARAIHLSIRRGLPGPAFALARVQYEGALKGHTIIHEVDLEELNSFTSRLQHWRQNRNLYQAPPRIEITEARWKFVGMETKGKSRSLRCDIAKLFVESVGNMGLLHDLAHSGMIHALQMLDEDGYIGPYYSDKNQTLLLSFSDRAVMFAIMTWPGSEQKYCREIESRVERTAQLRNIWQPHIRIPAA